MLLLCWWVFFLDSDLKKRRKKKKKRTTRKKRKKKGEEGEDLCTILATHGGKPPSFPVRTLRAPWKWALLASKESRTECG